MDTTTLLQAIYKAYREKRLADTLSYLDDDFRLIVHLPEEAMPGGNRPRSKAESALLFQGFLNDYDFVSYDHGPIIVIGDRATAHPLPPQADGQGSRHQARAFVVRQRRQGARARGALRRSRRAGVHAKPRRIAEAKRAAAGIRSPALPLSSVCQHLCRSAES